MPSIYEISVPRMKRTLQSTAHILKLGETWATEQGIPRGDITSWRLHENMLPLWAQVQFVAVQAQGLYKNLTGSSERAITSHEAPSLDDLYALVDEAIALLDTVDSAEKVTVGESDIVPLHGAVAAQYQMTLLDSIFSYTIPNAYFHLVTLYDIFRLKGVPLGKAEYMTYHMRDVIKN